MLRFELTEIFETIGAMPIKSRVFIQILLSPPKRGRLCHYIILEDPVLEESVN